MTETNMYDQFSQDYDRFVDWEARLAVELPFLISEIADHKNRLGRPVRVLDSACGTGQHAIALAKKGIAVAGADFSKEMVNLANQNAIAAGFGNMPFYRAGFGEAAAAFGKSTFDVLLCLGNSLPHVQDETNLVQTLIDFSEVLQPGGKLIIQNRNFDQVLENKTRWMPPQTYHEGNQTWIFARFYDFEPNDHITFNILILKGEHGKDFEQNIINTHLWAISKAQLESALDQTGFAHLQFYGDLQGSSFELSQSGNLVAVATKA